jgi:hypothetical protein
MDFYRPGQARATSDAARSSRLRVPPGPLVGEAHSTTDFEDVRFFM